MPIAAFDTIEPVQPLATLPARLLQFSSRSTRMLQIAIGSILASAMSIPFALVATVSIEHPSARDIILARPGACLQIALGLALWTALFALPLRRVLARLDARQIDITESTITVSEIGILRNQKWQQPLASYRGVAHHIRASVSGTRHELILVHPERDRSIMLAFADRIHQSEVDRVCRLIGLPEIQPRELYQLSPAKPEQGEMGASLQPA